MMNAGTKPGYGDFPNAEGFDWNSYKNAGIDMIPRRRVFAFWILDLILKYS